MNALKQVHGLTGKQRREFGKALRTELAKFENPVGQPEILPA